MSSLSVLTASIFAGENMKNIEENNNINNPDLVVDIVNTNKDMNNDLYKNDYRPIESQAVEDINRYNDLFEQKEEFRVFKVNYAVDRNAASSATLKVIGPYGTEAKNIRLGREGSIQTKDGRTSKKGIYKIYITSDNTSVNLKGTLDVVKFD